MRKARVKHPRMRPGDRGILCHVLGPRQSTAPQTDHAEASVPFLTSTDVTRFLLALALTLTVAVPAHGVDVGVDDTADEYLISGSTVLDGSSPDAAAALACPDCHWRVVVICDSGSLDDRRGCDALPTVCDTRRAELWRAIAPAQPPLGDPAWEYRGVICLRDAPVAVSVVATAIPELVRQAVPPLAAGSLPANTSLTQLPTSFFSGQPAAHVLPPIRVSGARVTIHLQPTWRWDFGHGSPIVTKAPGRRARTSAVQHRFPRRGIYRIRVDTTWHATYDINDATGFVVSDPITQSAHFDLRIREARRFLLHPRSTT